MPTASGLHSKAERSPSPPPPAYIRDSASSHTVVDVDSLRDVETFQTPLSPASMQRKSRRRRNGCVDDILGLYNAERSRSRGTAHSQATRSTMLAHESSPTTHITALKSLTSTTISSTECNCGKDGGSDHGEERDIDRGGKRRGELASPVIRHSFLFFVQYKGLAICSHRY